MEIEAISMMSLLWAHFINFLPKFISGLILLIIGLFVGKLVGKAVKHILQRAKLDYYVSETAKPRVSLTDIFALITRWWIYLAFISAAIDVLQIPTLSGWIVRITTFIPSIIGAALIIIVAYVIAEYIKEQVKKGETIYSNIVGKLIFFFIMYVAVAIALPVLGVPSGLVSNILLVIVASVGLGLAIALGLGLKDAVSDISKNYIKKYKFKK